MLNLVKFTFTCMEEDGLEVLYTAEGSVFQGQPVYIVMWQEDNLAGVVYTMEEAKKFIEVKHWNIVEVIEKIEL